MNACLRHRGPDSADTWVEPRGLGVLAFSRLAIQDLSPAANQPMHSESGRYVLVYNGEVYNADELRALIGRAPQSFRTHSDTEVLLACFEGLGLERTLQAVNGMFAIVLWDRESGSLFLARDRLGKKPLHYAAGRDCVSFASEIKSILRVQDAPRALDREALQAYFHLTYIPAPLTIFSGIRKVRPGHVLRIAPDLSIDERPYWSLHSVIANRNSRRLRYDEALEQAEALLEDAIRRRLISDAPVGVLLSGGIDSSLVSYILARRLNTSLETFTVGVEPEELDESAQAREIAAQLGVKHTVLSLSSDDALRLVDRVEDFLDEPFGDPSSIPTYVVCNLARRGATVLLSGDGGDEVFGGYTRHLWGAGWRGLAAHAYARYRRRNPFLSTAEVALEMYRRLLTTGACGGSAPVQFLPRLVGRLNGFNGARALDYLRYLDFMAYLPDDILVKVDRMSMANSIELRSPFLDYRLVELSWSLRADALVRGDVRKRLTRDLFVRNLGGKYLQTKKHGFALPIADWLRGPLREQLRAAFDAVRCREDSPWSREDLDFLARHLPAGNMTIAYRCWSVLALWHWSQKWEKYADKTSAVAATV
jgi:asparagine synthase (glutamine-hydrolysing)